MSFQGEIGSLGGTMFLQVGVFILLQTMIRIRDSKMDVSLESFNIYV